MGGGYKTRNSAANESPRVLPHCQVNMTAAHPLTFQGCRVLMLICFALAAAADGGAGIGDYEYEYDTLPREHLTRFGRNVEAVAPGPAGHIQHVPAHAPPAPETAATFIQRVPRRTSGTTAEEASAPKTSAAPMEPAEPASSLSEPSHEPEPATELQPPARVESAAEDLSAEQAPQVPATLPYDRLENMNDAEDAQGDMASTVQGPRPKATEDMETANFFWGLGPVYPHLYVYRRVPHLVPLHGWNPYHAYLLTHPASAK